MTAATTDPLIGRQLGNYRITAVLGVGGMARVYRATQIDIGREAAVKVLAPSFASLPEIVRRFRTEAQAANKIRHPNIVQIFDFGTLDDGRPYYLMELFEGESLAGHIRRVGPIPIVAALGILDPVLDALEATHRAGIVHRDLKPDNVFLAREGGRTTVKLLDFGIAKLQVDGVDKTRTGALMGTPAYMSPEQCEGKSDLGPATDIYAVGCMLYEMLCGVVPFDAESFGGLIKQHLIMTPRPLAERVQALPVGVSAIVARCLAKEPGDRPHSADELRRALAPFATTAYAPTGAPGPMMTAPTAATLMATSAPATAGPSPVPVAPRSRVPVIAIGGVLVVAVATLAILLVTHRGSQAPPAADARAIDAASIGVVDARPPDAPLPDASPIVDAPILDGRPTLVERLETLKRLCAEGTFSPAACAERRQQILDEK